MYLVRDKLKKTKLLWLRAARKCMLLAPEQLCFFREFRRLELQNRAVFLYGANGGIIKRRIRGRLNIQLQGNPHPRQLGELRHQFSEDIVNLAFPCIGINRDGSEIPLIALRWRPRSAASGSRRQTRSAPPARRNE